MPDPITERIAEWGIHKLGFALVNKTNGAITSFGDVTMHPGAISLNISAGNNTDNALAADDGRYYGGAGSKTKTGELVVALFNNWFRTNVLGEISEGGGLGEGDASSVEFAMLWETNSDQGGTRNVWYDCTAGDIVKNFQTNTVDGTVTYATETSTITSTIAELPNGERRRKWSCEKGSANYDTFFDAVYFPTSGTTGSTTGN